MENIINEILDAINEKLGADHTVEYLRGNDKSILIEIDGTQVLIQEH